MKVQVSPSFSHSKSIEDCAVPLALWHPNLRLSREDTEPTSAPASAPPLRNSWRRRGSRVERKEGPSEGLKDN